MAQAIILLPVITEAWVRSCQSVCVRWWRTQALEHVYLESKFPGILYLAYQTLKKKALRPTETSVTIDLTAHFSIPEDMDIAVACTHVQVSCIQI